MANLNDVKKMAIELLNKEFTITTYYGTSRMSAMDLGYYFEFDNAKRMFGRCFYIEKKITLSKPLCSENLDKIESRITNTMLHELAHAFCVKVYGINHGRGHGANWKSIAKQIGCDGERCYNGNEVNKPKSKYMLVCETCNKETPKYKKTKRESACAICCRTHNNGKYTDKYKLKLVVNY